MQNLQVFFINHFDSQRISDDAIRKFAEDHLQRISKGGDYPALATALEAAYQAYFGAITDEATKAAIREGQTKAVNSAVETIKKTISQQEGLVRAKFGKDAPAYQEFFPQGVSEFSRATLENVEEKLVRFINAATAHSADLPGFAAQFTSLKGQFSAARDAQLGTKGQVAAGKAASSGTRDALERQLMTNVLTIALDHIGKPSEGLGFFDQTILMGGSFASKKTSAPQT